MARQRDVNKIFRIRLMGKGPCFFRQNRTKYFRYRSGYHNIGGSSTVISGIGQVILVVNIKYSKQETDS